MRTFSNLLIAPIAIFLLSCCSNSPLEIKDLQCEYLCNPLAIDNTTPHLSWQMQSKQPTEQTAYQILAATSPQKLQEGKADLWDSGKQKSDQSVAVHYEGKPLTSGSQVYWKVRVWDVNGKASGWSKAARFGVGLLDASCWKAKYIGIQQPKERDLSPLLRQSFTIEQLGEELLLHVNSLGYHEVYINGQAVSDAVLTPAVVQYDKRSLTVTYDVAPFIRKGENEIVIWISKGWYQNGLPGVADDGPYVRAQLESLQSGEWVTKLITDEAWQTADCGYETFGDWRAHGFGGERIDARKMPKGLTQEALSALQWQQVKTIANPTTVATPQMVELNRITDRFHPISMSAEGDTAWVYDMGTNYTGFTRIVFPDLQAGQEVRLSYCDFMEDFMEANKTFRDGHYQDFYIASGTAGEYFENKFNYKSYRYLKISGITKAPSLEQITAMPVRTGYNGTSSFSCSDEDLNAIHDMIHRTLPCLTLGGDMVDCPTIERLGYGGDGNASTPTVQMMYNMAPTYLNWVQAWSDCMREDGSMPHTAPCPYMAGGGPYWCGFIIHASWNSYLNYGDSRLMERYYADMQQWLKYVDAHSEEGLLKPWPNTDYRQWYLGDWATPTGIDQTDPRSVNLVDNCAISMFLQEISKIAALLGKQADSKRYAEQAKVLNGLIHTTFFDPQTASYATGTQIDLIYPLLVGATPEELVPAVEKTLQQVTDTVFGGHLATGLVGIPIITDWATRNGKADFITSMLRKRSYPGYLYMIDHGATTTWEHWNGHRSHIHNCYNGIGSWFYSALAGIQADEQFPGYKHIFLRPQLAEGISWVKASKTTPYGQLSVAWEKSNTSYQMSVTIPIGSSATVLLPFNPKTTEVDGVATTDNSQTLDLKSGTHTIRCTL